MYKKDDIVESIDSSLGGSVGTMGTIILINSDTLFEVYFYNDNRYILLSTKSHQIIKMDYNNRYNMIAKILSRLKNGHDIYKESPLFRAVLQMMFLK